MGHELVPEHIVLSDEEAKEVLEKYKINKENLPKISQNDPVIRAIGSKKGDIVKIIRNSPTAGKAVYYRLVVD